MLELLDIDFNKLQLKSIGSWPILLRIGLLCCSAIVFTMVAYFIYFEPKLILLNRNELLLNDKNRTYIKDYNTIMQLQNIKLQWQLLQDLYNNNCYVNPIITTQSFIEHLSMIAGVNSVSIIEVNVTELAEVKDSYQVALLDLIAAGDYQQIATWLSMLVQTDIFTIEKFNLRVNRLEVEVKLYIDKEKTLNNLLACNRRIETLYHGNNLRNPFVNVSQPAENIIDEIIIGYLKDKYRSCVLVRDNLGFIRLIENAKQ